MTMMQILSAVLITTGGVLLAEGLVRWARRRPRAEWVPRIGQGVAGAVPGYAGVMDLLPLFTLATLAILASTILEVRMRHDAAR
jgi:hypothetical protein